MWISLFRAQKNATSGNFFWGTVDIKKCPHVYFKGPDMEGRWETEENVEKKTRIFLYPQGSRFLKPARP